MEKLYKLSLPSEAEWLTVKESLIVDGIPRYKSIHVNRQLSYPPTYDEEGEMIEEDGLYPDWAVDLISEDYIPELDKYLLKPRDSYKHNISGGSYEVVIAKPNDSWLKADIQKWLTDNSIEWTTPMLKVELLSLV